MLISDSLGKGTLLPTNDAIPHINDTTHYQLYYFYDCFRVIKCLSISFSSNSMIARFELRTSYDLHGSGCACGC